MTKNHQRPLSRFIAFFTVVAFSFSLIVPPGSYAQNPSIPAGVPGLPVPGTLVPSSAGYMPVLIQGMTLHPDNPLKFDFIVDTGNSGLQSEDLTDEANKLIKYFLASLTVPEKDMWVNLSPHEGDRIAAESFGQTEMGRDVLAQDYILKQLTASMIYPEEELGKQFWEKVRQKAYDLYGTTEIPVETFNKVWIVPDKAVIFESRPTNTAFVVEARLKVMLEEDYMALANAKDEGRRTRDVEYTSDVSRLTSDVVREIIIPELEREVNEGQHFASLRQIYQSLILATWYKKKLRVGATRESPLQQFYLDKSKIRGVDVADKDIKQKIYEQYLEAYRKGVYNYIKEDFDPASQQIIPRKYFSGGVTLLDVGDVAMVTEDLQYPGVAERFTSMQAAIQSDRAMVVKAGGEPVEEQGSDAAMLSFGSDSTHARIFRLMMELMPYKGIPAEEIQLGKMLDIGLETDLFGTLKGANLVSILREQGVDIVGLDPQARHDPSAGFFRGTVQRMPFADGSFDTIVSIGLFNEEFFYVEKMSEAGFKSPYDFYYKAAEEIKRVLKPDGKFLVSMGNFPNEDFFKAFREVFKDAGFEFLALNDQVGGLYLLASKGFSHRGETIGGVSGGAADESPTANDPSTPLRDGDGAMVGTEKTQGHRTHNTSASRRSAKAEVGTPTSTRSNGKTSEQGTGAQDAVGRKSTGDETMVVGDGAKSIGQRAASSRQEIGGGKPVDDAAMIGGRTRRTFGSVLLGSALLLGGGIYYWRDEPQKNRSLLDESVAEAVVENIGDLPFETEREKDDTIKKIIELMHLDPTKGLYLLNETINRYLEETRYEPLIFSWPEIGDRISVEINQNEQLKYRFVSSIIAMDSSDAPTAVIDALSFVPDLPPELIYALASRLRISGDQERDKILYIVLKDYTAFRPSLIEKLLPWGRDSMEAKTKIYVESALKDIALEVLNNMQESFMYLSAQELDFIENQIDRLTLVDLEIGNATARFEIDPSIVLDTGLEYVLAHEIGHNVLQSKGGFVYQTLEERALQEFFAYLTSAAYANSWRQVTSSLESHQLASEALNIIQRTLGEKSGPVDWRQVWTIVLKMILEDKGLGEIPDRVVYEYEATVMRDQAMPAIESPVVHSNYGGVDLEKVDVQIREDGAGGVVTSFENPQQLEMLMNSEGLGPVIYSIQPMTVPMLHFLLGYAGDSSEETALLSHKSN
jgi:SAM-dependent methyltransferase